MKLMELLREDVVKVGLESADKWEVINELVDLLVAAHEVRMHDRNKIIEALVEREKSMSTGLQHGLAIPHATVDLVEDLVAALGIAPQGIPFESLDDRPTKIVLLIVVPRDKYGIHLKTLAGVANLLDRPALREQLVQARTPGDVMRRIIDEEEGS